MGFGGVKRGGGGGGRVKFIICGSKCNANRGRPVYMGTDDSHYVILLYSNFIAILTEYCKRFYRIPLFTKLLLLYLFGIYWDWQGQKCVLKCPKVTSMRLKQNYSVHTEISVRSHPCDTNTFTHSLTATHLLPLKTHNIWMDFFEIKKFSI